jgi:hypothetical protein
MNLRLIIFSGIMAALIGAMMGLAVSRIAQRIERRQIFLITGASLGFAIGTFQECVRQQRNERDEEENNE